MKTTLLLIVALFGLALLLGPGATPWVSTRSWAEEKTSQTPPDVLQLASQAKLGPVTFNHTNHTTKTYNISGTGPIECTECHHVEQPAAEVAKHPPMKSAWPADRTSKLTGALLKEPNAPRVTPCRDCHAPKDQKPKVWPSIPEIKHEGSTALVVLTNQQAFHRACAGCHDAAVKVRPIPTAPKTMQCAACHKKAA